jgi:hypothetical protein
MFKKQWLAVAVLVVATSSLSIYSCSDDEPAGPGTGGDDGTGSKIAAGVYDLTVSQWTCGMTDTMTFALEQVECSDISFDELFELDCPVNISNNSFNIDCSSTEDDGLCSYTERVQVTGTRVGNTWTVTGTINISNQNPADCSDEPDCANVLIVFDMASGPPSACTYAGANLIEATIVGGPLAGSTDFDTFGSGSGAGGIFAWNFTGDAGDFIAVQQQGASPANFAIINVGLADIDVSSLPATFSVSVIGGGASSSAPPTGSVYYSDQTTAGDWFSSTGGSGSITVNEVSDMHIAGTINSLSINGQTTPAGGGTPTPATRSLSGGFHVRVFIGPPGPPGPPTTESAPRKGWVGRILSK